MGKKYGIYLLVSVIFIGLSLSFFRTHPSVSLGDSHKYLQESSKPVTSAEFWSHPLTLMLFYKACKGDAGCITNSQFGLFLVSWLVLAIATALVQKKRAVQYAAFALILLLALSTNSLIWTRILMTESLATPLFALMVGCWLLAIRFMPHQPKYQILIAIGIGIVMLIWSFSRHSNPFFILGIGGLTGIFALLFWRNLAQQRALIFSFVVSCIVIFSLQYGLSTQKSELPLPTLPNIILVEIIPTPEKRAFFEEHGMPVSDELIALGGNRVSQLEDMPSEYVEWLYSDEAPSTYTKYLLNDPPARMKEPIQNWESMLGANLYDYLLSPDPTPPPLTQLADTILYFPSGFWLVALFIGVGGFSLFAVLERQKNIYWVVPIFLLLLVYPMMFLIWFFGEYERGRHGLGTSLQLRLGLWLFLLISLDMLIQASQQPSWRIVPPRRFQYGLLALIVPLLCVDIVFHMPFIQRNILLPLQDELFPEKHALRYWADIPDIEYLTYQDNLDEFVENDTSIIHPASYPEDEAYIIQPTEWSFTSQKYLNDGTKDRALTKWQETLQPQYLQTLEATYIYIDSEWQSRQNDFQRTMLESNYELIQTWNNRQLYRVKMNDAKVSSEMGMSEETATLYQTHISSFDIPSDALIFNPVTGELDWFGSIEELGQYIEVNRNNQDLLPSLFDLLTVWQQMKYEADLSFTSKQAESLAQWRATKHSPYLREAGIDYLLVSDLWMQYLTQEEFELLLYSGGYQLVHEWQSEIPGSYKLYKVVG